MLSTTSAPAIKRHRPPPSARRRPTLALPSRLTPMTYAPDSLHIDATARPLAVAPRSRGVAALSGGVDSATAAALLVEQGHRVVGMTMRLYDARGTAASSGGRCCGPRDIEDARAVCAHLGIPHYVVDLAARFGEAGGGAFVRAYLAGETPSPCVKCNQHIKFTPLLARARAIGAELLVTGHYAQIVARGPEPGDDL